MSSITAPLEELAAKVDKAGLSAYAIQLNGIALEIREMLRDGWIELPKDGKGNPIEIGMHFRHKSGKEYEVKTFTYYLGYKSIRNGKWCVNGDGLAEDGEVFEPQPPDTQEAIDEDEKLSGTEYCNRHGLKSLENAEYPYDELDAGTVMLRHILQRQRELDGRA